MEKAAFMPDSLFTNLALKILAQRPYVVEIDLTQRRKEE